jgi:hypothetical protein
VSSGCHVKCSSSSVGDDDDGLIVDEDCKDGQVKSVEPRRVRITEDESSVVVVQSGSKWTKRMQKEWEVTDGGMAVDMEVLARALSWPCAGSGARACEQFGGVQEVSKADE